MALSSVDIDYRTTCRHAATMLIRKGHWQIMLLLPAPSHGGDIESELGFREAFRSSAATPIVIHHRETAGRVVTHMNALLKRVPSPTAFVVARSVHTLTVITHCA